MMTMSGVWDNTTEVLRGRSAILTRLAVPTLFLPAVIRDGWTAYTAPAPGLPPAPVAAGVGGLIAILAVLVTIWGQLAITAVAVDPATDQSDAARQATRRFGPALGVYAIAGLVVALLFVPLGVALVGSNIDWAAMSRGVSPQIAPGTAGFVGLYLLVFVIAALIVAARLFVLNPVIVNERRGLGAFGRAWSLTRGLTWRIIGATVLFAIVWGVALGAARLIVGIVARLLLGADATGTVGFVVALVAAAITTVYMVVVSSFAAQLYAQRTHMGVADVFA